MFHVPPFNASDVFYPSYATSSSSDSDHDGGHDRCANTGLQSFCVPRLCACILRPL